MANSRGNSGRSDISLSGAPKPLGTVIAAMKLKHVCSLEAKLWQTWVKVEVKSLTRVRLCDPVDYSPPGFSVHGILQTRILEWVDMPFSREFSQPRDRTRMFYISCISRGVLYEHNTVKAINELCTLKMAKMSFMISTFYHNFLKTKCFRAHFTKITIRFKEKHPSANWTNGWVLEFITWKQSNNTNECCMFRRFWLASIL